ncbi:Bug family tripartite tricarboxylate transporter substrate binding protein [Bordetella petrii]|uniref:Bug family tripartite tricarboxylate transporter substrate binding protein n=1 Tax=Bordetella petrii TaxID=94624 RepID=UPI001A960AEC|nr:tripartite tricarboxylate transporter substrate binding protein [Bordetella petrii]MBO1114839.1 tripartite tricarboxylate transporter substrate binding protein [Bordetella petrii]
MNRYLKAAAALLLAAGALQAQAADYPARAIEWVVPYPAGGGTDIVARTLAEKMTTSLGQPLVIANKPGAATAIGADYVARAQPDGYTMLSGDTATLAANPALYPKLSYDPATDLKSVGLMARFAMILVVNPSVPAKTLDELAAWVKSQAKGVDYATPGSGSPHHLATELFRLRTGLNLVHVPYRGAAPAVQDVIGGQVPMMFVDSATGQQYIKSGRLRAIAVASAKRLESMPDTPTLIELGLKDFEAYAWQGLLVPKGTSDAIVDRLNTALRGALDSAEVREKFKSMGLEAIPSTPQEMTAYAAAEREKWGKVIRDSKITVN